MPAKVSPARSAASTSGRRDEESLSRSPEPAGAASSSSPSYRQEVLASLSHDLEEVRNRIASFRQLPSRGSVDSSEFTDYIVAISQFISDVYSQMVNLIHIPGPDRDPTAPSVDPCFASLRTIAASVPLARQPVSRYGSLLSSLRKATSLYQMYCRASPSSGLASNTQEDITALSTLQEQLLSVFRSVSDYLQWSNDSAVYLQRKYTGLLYPQMKQTGLVQHIVRLRPRLLNRPEDSVDTLQMRHHGVVLSTPLRKEWPAHWVLDAHSTQEDLLQLLAPQVDVVLRGGSASIVALGPSFSGKTYSSLGPKGNLGFIPTLLEALRHRGVTSAHSSAGESSFSMTLSVYALRSGGKGVIQKSPASGGVEKDPLKGSRAGAQSSARGTRGKTPSSSTAASRRSSKMSASCGGVRSAAGASLLSSSSPSTPARASIAGSLVSVPVTSAESLALLLSRGVALRSNGRQSLVLEATVVLTIASSGVTREGHLTLIDAGTAGMPLIYEDMCSLGGNASGGDGDGQSSLWPVLQASVQTRRGLLTLVHCLPPNPSESELPWVVQSGLDRFSHLSTRSALAWNVHVERGGQGDQRTLELCIAELSQRNAQNRADFEECLKTNVSIQQDFCHSEENYLRRLAEFQRSEEANASRIRLLEDMVHDYKQHSVYCEELRSDLAMAREATETRYHRDLTVFRAKDELKRRKEAARVQRDVLEREYAELRDSVESLDDERRAAAAMQRRGRGRGRGRGLSRGVAQGR